MELQTHIYVIYALIILINVFFTLHGSNIRKLKNQLAFINNRIDRFIKGLSERDNTVDKRFKEMLELISMTTKQQLEILHQLNAINDWRKTFEDPAVRLNNFLEIFKGYQVAEIITRRPYGVHAEYTPSESFKIDGACPKCGSKERSSKTGLHGQETYSCNNCAECFVVDEEGNSIALNVKTIRRHYAKTIEPSPKFEDTPEHREVIKQELENVKNHVEAGELMDVWPPIVVGETMEATHKLDSELRADSRRVPRRDIYREAAEGMFGKPVDLDQIAANSVNLDHLSDVEKREVIMRKGVAVGPTCTFQDNAHPVSHYLTDKNALEIVKALASGEYKLPQGEVRHVSIDIAGELAQDLENAGYEVKIGKLYTKITKL